MEVLRFFYDFCGVSAKTYFGLTGVLMFQYFWLSFVAYLLIQATVSSRLDRCSVVLFIGNNEGFKVFYDFCGVSAKTYFGVTGVLVFQYFWLSFVA